MNFEEFSKKRLTLEKGIKRVQLKFLIVPVVVSIAIANLFLGHTLEDMVAVALIVGVIIGWPLQFYISKKIDSTAAEMGFKCSHCGQTFPLKKLGEIENTRKCPACENQVLN